LWIIKLKNNNLKHLKERYSLEKGITDVELLNKENLLALCWHSSTFYIVNRKI
jgi:hypothetical protein